jgi:hypothetical protein
VPACRFSHNAPHFQILLLPLLRSLPRVPREIVGTEAFLFVCVSGLLFKDDVSSVVERLQSQQQQQQQLV